MKLTDILKEVIREKGEQDFEVNPELLAIRQKYDARKNKMQIKGTTNRSKSAGNGLRKWDLTKSEIVLPNPQTLKDNLEDVIELVKYEIQEFFDNVTNAKFGTVHKYEPITPQEIKAITDSVKYNERENKLEVTIPKDAWVRMERELRTTYPKVGKRQVFVGYINGAKEREQRNAVSNQKFASKDYRKYKTDGGLGKGSFGKL